jgi:hypothetical protein
MSQSITIQEVLIILYISEDRKDLVILVINFKLPVILVFLVDPHTWLAVGVFILMGLSYIHDDLSASISFLSSLFLFFIDLSFH